VISIVNIRHLDINMPCWLLQYW